MEVTEHLHQNWCNRFPNPAGRNSDNSSTQLSGGSCSNSITDESLSKLPYGARRPMCSGNHGVERLLDPCAVLVRDGQRGQELDRMIAVSRNLGEQLVIVEQRDHDQLAEQSAACGFQQFQDALSLAERGGPNSMPIISPLPRTDLISS